MEVRVIVDLINEAWFASFDLDLPVRTVLHVSDLLTLLENRRLCNTLQYWVYIVVFFWWRHHLLGWMAEWSKALVLGTSLRAWVRIPLQSESIFSSWCTSECWRKCILGRLQRNIMHWNDIGSVTITQRNWRRTNNTIKMAHVIINPVIPKSPRAPQKPEKLSMTYLLVVTGISARVYLHV